MIFWIDLFRLEAPKKALFISNVEWHKKQTSTYARYVMRQRLHRISRAQARAARLHGPCATAALHFAQHDNNTSKKKSGPTELLSYQ